MLVLRGDRVVTRTSSGDDGRFRISVDAGGYKVVAGNAGAYPSSANASVTVRPGRAALVTLTVDSGIR